MSGLPVMPVITRFDNIGLLRAFVPTTQQQHDFLPVAGVVHAVALPHINTQFPDAVLAGLAVAKVALCHTEQSAVNGSLSFVVAQRIMPFRKWNLAVLRVVGLDFKHDQLLLLSENMSIRTGQIHESFFLHPERPD